MPERHSTDGQLRGVLYCRCSDPRQDTSVEQQIAWAGPAARKNNVHIVRTFTDEGIPGREIDDRPGLQATLSFLEDAAARGDALDVLVCWDMDRFSRANSIRTAAVLGRLLEAGTTRILTAEGWTDLDNDADLLMQHVKQDFSRAAYSKSISKNVTRAALERARRGEFCGSRTPYAYRRDEAGKLTPGDPAEVATVRLIFDLYATGCWSLRQIAERLRKGGTSAPSGRSWTRAAVHEILTNERYTGTAIWNEDRQGQYFRVVGGEVRASRDLAAREAAKRRRGLKLLPAQHNDRQDMVIVENAHPALVSRELFEKCQRLLASRRCASTPKVGRGDWSLTGFTHCGCCGAVMHGVGQIQQKNGKRYIYRTLICSTAQKHGALAADGCRAEPVHQARLVNEVVAVIQKHLLNRKALAALRRRLEQLAGTAAADQARRLGELKARLDELERRVGKAAARVLEVDSDLLGEAQAQLRALKAERDGCREELDRARAEAEASAPAGRADLEEVLQLVGRLGEVAREATPQELRAALSRLVSKVTVRFEDAPGRAGRVRPRFSRLDVELHPDFLNLLAPTTRS